MRNNTTKPRPHYERLSRGRTWVGQHEELWLGDDHLLIVDGSSMDERYRRMPFPDIEAIVYVRSPRRAYMNLLWALPLAICALVLISAIIENDPEVWVSTGFTALFALPLLINTLRGQTVTAQIRTRVQVETLISLRRRRKVEKVLARLAPAIEAAQGTWTPGSEPIPERPTPAAAVAADPPPATPEAPAEFQPRETAPPAQPAPPPAAPPPQGDDVP